MADVYSFINIKLETLEADVATFTWIGNRFCIVPRCIVVLQYDDNTLQIYAVTEMESVIK